MKRPSFRSNFETRTKCHCGTAAERYCFRCDRPLCGEHQTRSPHQGRSGIDLVPVCHPVCDAQWWRQADGFRHQEA